MRHSKKVCGCCFEPVQKVVTRRKTVLCPECLELYKDIMFEKTVREYRTAYLGGKSK